MFEQEGKFRVFKNRLSEWQTKASVRATPMRSILAADEGLPFSPELVPLMAHPVIANQEANIHKIILGQKIHDYLRFTSHLECKAIVPACTMLGLREAPIEVTQELALDGLKIAVDETHHALCAEDMKSQITAITGVAPYREHLPPFLDDLKRQQVGMGPEDKALALLTFACVSETLITSTLAKLPADEKVIAGIRDVVQDHARDEAKHHSYFSYIMASMWEQLPAHKRDLVGPLFAEFIQSFLTPNLIAELDWLEAAGFSRGEAKLIVEDTYSQNMAAYYREASRPTVLLMERYGMLEHAATYDALAKRALLDGPVLQRREKRTGELTST